MQYIFFCVYNVTHSMCRDDSLKQRLHFGNLWSRRISLLNTKQVPASRLPRIWALIGSLPQISGRAVFKNTTQIRLSEWIHLSSRRSNPAATGESRSSDDPRKNMMKNSRPFFPKGLPSPFARSLARLSVCEERCEKSRDDPPTTEEGKRERACARVRHWETFKNIRERERGHFRKTRRDLRKVGICINEVGRTTNSLIDLRSLRY